MEHGGPVADGCFELTRDGEGLCLTIGSLFRDSLWAATGGEVARILRGEEAKALEINFSQTAWADPLPLLSLSCLIREFADRNPKGQITVSLGRERRGNSNRFPVFFATQGFIKVLPPSAVVTWDGTEYDAAERDRLVHSLREFDSILAFQSADCIAAKVISTASLDHSKILNLVEGFVQEGYERRISQWLSTSARQRDFILHEMGALLLECLDNVFEHAYPGEGYAAIYARLRGGIPEDGEQFSRWNSISLAERQYCPALARCNCGKRPGWLELFVCDVGSGLTEKLTTDTAAPLLKLSNKLFREPLSRHANREFIGKTTITGLQHIGFILGGETDERRGDFVRLYSTGEWVGEHLPWPPTELQAAHTNYRNKAGLNPVPGTALHFAVEPVSADLEEQRRSYPEFFMVPTHEDLADVRAALRRTDEPKFQPPHVFIDLYVGERAAISGRGKAVREWARKVTEETLVLRPSRTVRKADVLDQIYQLGQSHSPVKLIAFTDVSASLAVDLGHIIRRDKLSELWPSGDLTIVIIAQDWSTAVFRLELDRKTFQVDVDAARRFLTAAEGRVGAPFIAEILRAEDSELFWKDVGSAYLNEDVVWGTTGKVATSQARNIRGYIDLPLALANRSRFDAGRRSMRRTIAAFGPQALVVSDDLIRSLVSRDFVVRDGNRPLNMPDEQGSVVVVGSVAMTGSTTDRFVKRGGARMAGAVHLLRHKDAPIPAESHTTALLWMPPNVPVRRPKAPRYERILNSPFIIRGGEKAVPLPRFSAPVDGDLGPSLYGEEPNIAYQHWQRLGLLKLGHWTYNLHHDLLTVRLLEALEYHADEIIRWVQDYVLRWQLEFGERKVHSAIVYPRHPVTDRLMRLLSNSAGEELPPLFPLQVVRSSSVSPLMPSPVERELLGQHMRRIFKPTGLVILIDDGVVTGNTMQQLRQTIEGLWDAVHRRERLGSYERLHIRSIALLDRTALPTQRGLVEKATKYNPRLWRWDVPPMGREGSCRLCNALDKCRDLERVIPSRELANRISQWIHAWQPIPVEVSRGDHGLPPKLLPNGDFTRFCIERSDNGSELSHSVYHFYSTSRAAIAAEICRSTTRSDYPLEKAKSGRFKDGTELDIQTKIEILVVQILLFSEELSFVERIERLEVLVELLWSTAATSPATALAALAVMVDFEALPGLWKHCETLIENSGFPNDDALIVAFAIHHFGRITQPHHVDNKEWALLQLLIAPTHAARGPLCRVFQIFGWDADSAHKGLLLDLLRKPIATSNDIYQIFLILNSLCEALRALDSEGIRTTMVTPTSDAAQLQIFIDEISRFVKSKLPIRVETDDETTVFRFAASLIETSQLDRDIFVGIRDKIYSFLFVGVHSAQSRYRSSLTVRLDAGTPSGLLLENSLKKLEQDWDSIIRHKNSNDLSDRWSNRIPQIIFCKESWSTKGVLVYADAEVRLALKELISNVMHSIKPIPCPWPGHESFPNADMWIRIKGEAEGFFAHVEMANSVADEPLDQMVERTVNSLHLLKIGGKIDCRIDREQSLYVTTVRLPTVTGLAWGAYGE